MAFSKLLEIMRLFFISLSFLWLLHEFSRQMLKIYISITDRRSHQVGVVLRVVFYNGARRQPFIHSFASILTNNVINLLEDSDSSFKIASLHGEWVINQLGVRYKTTGQCVVAENLFTDSPGEFIQEGI